MACTHKYIRNEVWCVLERLSCNVRVCFCCALHSFVLLEILHSVVVFLFKVILRHFSGRVPNCFSLLGTVYFLKHFSGFNMHCVSLYFIINAKFIRIHTILRTSTFPHSNGVDNLSSKCNLEKRMLQTWSYCHYSNIFLISQMFWITVLSVMPFEFFLIFFYIIFNSFGFKLVFAGVAWHCWLLLGNQFVFARDAQEVGMLCASKS